MSADVGKAGLGGALCCREPRASLFSGRNSPHLKSRGASCSSGPPGEVGAAKLQSRIPESVSGCSRVPKEHAEEAPAVDGAVCADAHLKCLDRLFTDAEENCTASTCSGASSLHSWMVYVALIDVQAR
mmetsp:Transcript_88756/g.285020  ORF Transcript_88756/g.285020 Transcript_88756/m.285020 type:complete len:128 (+) Transcript_88756:254-637(+)